MALNESALRGMQGVFILGGLALVITGLNGSRSLIFVGLGMVVLAVVGRLLGGTNSSS